jgi:peptide/nickel transport system ATP-binding protein
MLQRAMIAQALAGEPDLLIADEPTTALDVTIQAQILNLLAELQAETDMSVIFITHNINVLSYVADRIGVMYAGEIVERGTPAEIFEGHVHPYTAGLLGSIPEVAEGGDASARLTPIPGNVPSLLDHEMGDACYFADRCPKAMDTCLTKPEEYEVGDGHGVKCYLAEHEYDPARALDGDVEALGASDGGGGPAAEAGDGDGGEGS